MTRSLEIVIVSYNTSAELDACLASVYAHPPEHLERLVVVDNASTEPKVLLGRRHTRHVFMPGKFVFPGGRVDVFGGSQVTIGSLTSAWDVAVGGAGSGAYLHRYR